MSDNGMSTATARSLWIIDNLYGRARKIHAYRYLLFFICFVAFCISSYAHGITAEERTVLSYLGNLRVIAISFVAILVGVYRADFVFKWQCKSHPRVLKSTYSYLEQKTRKLAWELYGRGVPE